MGIRLLVFTMVPSLLCSPQLDSVHEGGPVSQYRRGDYLTEEEKRDNLRLLEERVEAAFPQEEMADPLYRDKVGANKGIAAFLWG